MRVFVTGGTGFVGGHVVAALRARGHEVTCLVRDPAKARARFGDVPPAIVAGDLERGAALARGVSDADAVVHLAGLVAARSRDELFAVNAAGTRALVDAVRASGARVRRFVHVSSLAAAGPIAPAGDEPPRPVSDYGRSKLAGEDPVRELAVPWTILRPPGVYGPHDREFLRLFRMARRGITPMFGAGAQGLSLVYVADLAAAVAACLGDAPAPGVHYPAHPTPTTARALVEAIGAALDVRVRVVSLPRAIVRPLFWVTGTSARLAGRTTLLSRDKANELLADAWLCSPTALEAATGWRAATDLATGLARTAAWYRAAGWL